MESALAASQVVTAGSLSVVHGEPHTTSSALVPVSIAASVANSASSTSSLSSSRREPWVRMPLDRAGASVCPEAEEEIAVL